MTPALARLRIRLSEVEPLAWIALGFLAGWYGARIARHRDVQVGREIDSHEPLFV